MTIQGTIGAIRSWRDKFGKMILAETAGWTREKKEREQKDQVADYRQ